MLMGWRGPSLVQQLVLIAPIAYIPFELIDARILVVVYPADPIEVGHAAHILRQVLGPVELLIHNGYDVAVGVQSSHNFLQLQWEFIKYFFFSRFLSVLTRCTQSLHSSSLMQRCSASGVNTKTKFFACRILFSKPLSNLPASRRSTSMNTEKPRSCRCT